MRCESEAEVERLYGTLSENGEPLTPLGRYGFSKRFGGTNDRFGVSSQLNLARFLRGTRALRRTR